MTVWKRNPKVKARICVQCDKIYLREKRESGRCQDCSEKEGQKIMNKAYKVLAKRKAKQ